MTPQQERLVSKAREALAAADRSLDGGEPRVLRNALRGARVARGR